MRKEASMCMTSFVKKHPRSHKTSSCFPKTCFLKETSFFEKDILVHKKTSFFQKDILFQTDILFRSNIPFQKDLLFQEDILCSTRHPLSKETSHFKKTSFFEPPSSKKTSRFTKDICLICVSVSSVSLSHPCLFLSHLCLCLRLHVHLCFCVSD